MEWKQNLTTMWRFLWTSISFFSISKVVKGFLICEGYRSFSFYTIVFLFVENWINICALDFCTLFKTKLEKDYTNNIQIYQKLSIKNSNDIEERWAINILKPFFASLNKSKHSEKALRNLLKAFQCVIFYFFLIFWNLSLDLSALF